MSHAYFKSKIPSLNPQTLAGFLLGFSNVSNVPGGQDAWEVSPRGERLISLPFPLSLRGGFSLCSLVVLALFYVSLFYTVKA